MGLDQYLYRIWDDKDYQKTQREIEKLNEKEEKLKKEIFNKYKPIAEDEFKSIKKRLLKLDEKYKNGEELVVTAEDDDIWVKLFNIVAHILKGKEIDKKTYENIQFYLFNGNALFIVWNMKKKEKEIENEFTDFMIEQAEKVVEKIKEKNPEIIEKIKEKEKIDRKIERLEKKLSRNTEEILYWRKAYMIHKWFRNHVKFKELDIESEFFDAEVLFELKKDVKKVLDMFNEEELENHDFILKPNDKRYAKVIEIFPQDEDFREVELDYWFFNKLRYTLEYLEDADIDEDDKFFYYAWY